ncbi:MAG: AAC(3) family N-acetyltransferase [Bacteroidia bacterium]
MMETVSDARQKIIEALLNLGVHPGITLLVHSSLSSLGNIPGGAETVIDALLHAVGPEGTLLMPALSYELVNDFQSVFDHARTASNIGIIPEHFRKRKSVIRSIHPTHSVCGSGACAEAILSGHESDNTPCGPNSPFRKIRDYEGFILMLGCGLRPNTSFHAIEELVHPPYLFRSFPLTYTIRTNENSTEKNYTVHNFEGWIQRYDRLRDVLGEPFLHKGKVLDATSWLISVPEMWAAVLSKMQEDPLYFVDRDD